jgi:multidrug efflux pump subunit AcrB
MAVFLQSGANALAVSDAIKARMVEMKPRSRRT